MPEINCQQLSQLYEKELVENVIPFWEKYSIDRQYGGYFTCLDRQGNVYDTDKFMWLQARQAWTFSMLYNRYEQRGKWLDIAKTGIDFLQKHGMDSQGSFYFALDRQGRPLVQPYNIFSDFFAAMAFAQYGIAADDKHARELSVRTYENILRRKADPKGKYNKTVASNRPLQSAGFPMIMANLCLEMEPLLRPAQLEQALDTCVSEVMVRHLDKKKNLMYEHVLPDGSHLDCFEGRLLNPGHGIEAMWFIMDIAVRRKDKNLINKTINVIINTLEYAWDKEYGGIFYFLDAEERPPVQLEWNQKLWWVHLETLVALAKGFMLTSRADCAEWYNRVHDYSWSHFADPEYGEWFGYLDRQGQVLLNLKGGKWKGCFHVPRAFYLCYRVFGQSQNSEK